MRTGAILVIFASFAATINSNPVPKIDGTDKGIVPDDAKPGAKNQEDKSKLSRRQEEDAADPAAPAPAEGEASPDAPAEGETSPAAPAEGNAETPAGAPTTQADAGAADAAGDTTIPADAGANSPGVPGDAEATTKASADDTGMLTTVDAANSPQEANDSESSTTGVKRVMITIGPNQMTPENVVTDNLGNPRVTNEIMNFTFEEGGGVVELYMEKFMEYQTKPATIPGCLCVSRAPLSKFKLYGNIHFKNIKIVPHRYVTTATEKSSTICPPCDCTNCEMQPPGPSLGYINKK